MAVGDLGGGDDPLGAATAAVAAVAERDGRGAVEGDARGAGPVEGGVRRGVDAVAGGDQEQPDVAGRSADTTSRSARRAAEDGLLDAGERSPSDSVTPPAARSQRPRAPSARRRGPARRRRARRAPPCAARRCRAPRPGRRRARRTRRTARGVDAAELLGDDATSSTGPAPMPPSSSANGRPRRPISASRPHMSSSKPGSSLATSRRCSASYPFSRPRTASRRAVCSESRVKSM